MKRASLIVMVLILSALAGHPTANAQSGGTDPAGHDRTARSEEGRDCIRAPRIPGFAAQGPVSVSRLLGIRVVNPLKEEIGKVTDIYLDPCGRVSEIQIRIGGFMGLGGRHVKLSVQQVRIRFIERPSGVVATVRETREHILREHD